MKQSRNRTIAIDVLEQMDLSKNMLKLFENASFNQISDKIINQDMLEASKFLPSNFVDMLFLDPPYNMSKSFNGTSFKKKQIKEYSQILDKWIASIIHTLKKTATIYICGDWHSSTSIHEVASKYFFVRNRITWEREKGRGALSNWKNCSEDIWFCTMSDDYYFNPESVKLKRKVIAPYRNGDNSPKDWDDGDDGKYRLTYPSNLWTDISVPFWSMPENTDHPTQKPEKLLAKLILASSKDGDMIFDPFLGSGTTAVVANKLDRKFLGIEQEEKYGCLALKRLEMARKYQEIQGYSDGVFWERNTLSEQKKAQKKSTVIKENNGLNMFGLMGVSA
jgi:site-specific DNA-methyltransferase (adenine-specific)